MLERKERKERQEEEEPTGKSAEDGGEVEGGGGLGNLGSRLVCDSASLQVCTDYSFGSRT